MERRVCTGGNEGGGENEKLRTGDEHLSVRVHIWQREGTWWGGK